MQKQNRTSILRDWRMLPLLTMGIAAVVLALPALAGEASMRILGQLQLTLQLIFLLLLGFLMRRARGKRETAFLLLTGLVAVGGIAAVLRPTIETAQGYVDAASLSGILGGIVVLLAMLICPNAFLRKPERLFLLLVAAFGATYVFGILPLAAPDEWYHYRATLTMASKLIYGTPVVDSAYLLTEGLTAHVNSAEAAATVAGGLLSETATGEMVSMGYLALDLPYTLPYVPQMLGTLLGMSLGVNRFVLYILGDITNLLFYVAVVYIAIRIMPKWKGTMALMATVPMALQQAASYSSDGFINALAYLLIAQILRIALNRERINWKNVLPLMLTSMLLAPTKAVYACMLLMLLIIPMDCYKNRLQKWLFLVGICAATAGSVIFFQLPKILETIGGGPSVEVAANRFTLSYALSHPEQTAMILLKSNAPNVLYFLAETAVGRQLAGLSLNLCYGDTWLILMILVASSVCVLPGEPTLRPKDRLTVLAAALIVYAAVCATMLFAWTEIDDVIIQGVQGRYFLPVIPLVLIALQSGNITVKKDPMRWLVCGYTLVSIMVMFEIGFRVFEP